MQPYTGFRCWAPGDNVTEVLGIQKYEKPISPQVAGQAKGHFPSFLRKTDQERIQNLTLEFHVWKTLGYTWEVTEKLDGSSMTMFYKDGKFGVCSRNLELIEDEKNTFWRVARESGFASEHDEDSQEIAVQGELVGPGIQGNPYELTTHRLYVFNLWEINPGEYAVPRVCRATVAADEGFNHVPIIATNQTLPATIAEVLEMADGQSMVGPGAREGVVWKCEQDPSISFKAISNKWLLKQKD